MNKKIMERVINESKYIINNKKTVRDTAKIFNVSKSTVHKDMQERLKDINSEDYNKVINVFNEHIEVRHINGGNATKIKYLKLKNY